MGDIFSQLAHLFVQTTPTVILVFALAFVLERILFRPLTQVLKQREDATVGALKRSRELAEATAAKAAEYEAAFQAARQEVYRQREASRKAALAERDHLLKSVREASEATVREGQATVKAETETIRQELTTATHSLALDIAKAVLGGAPSGSEGSGRR